MSTTPSPRQRPPKKGRDGSPSRSQNSSSAQRWAAGWLASVADGSNTMSQRKLSSIEKHGGGLDAVQVVAREKGVHLVLLTDDKGSELVAASTHPFKVVC